MLRENFLNYFRFQLSERRFPNNSILTVMNDPSLPSAKSLVRAKESLIEQGGPSPGRWFCGLTLSVIGLIPTGFAQTRKDGQPPVFFDFEAPAYTLGSVHGQRGWSVDQGRAEITAGAGRNASTGLVLEPLRPFSQATLRLDAPAADSTGGPAFLDFYLSPSATDVLRQEELLDVDGARIGFFRSSTDPGQGRFWIFDGDGSGGGFWQETSVVIPVEPATGRPAGWLRLTLRGDYAEKTWDLWINGVLASANAGYQETTEERPMNYVILGDAVERLVLDDFGIGTNNPFGQDRDRDGMLDADEKIIGSNPGLVDRNAVDAIGVPFLDKWMSLLADQASQSSALPLPAFSITSGVVQSPFSLELDAKKAASVYYTLDGTTPTPEKAQKYNGPISIETTTVVRACAADSSGRTGRIVSGAWIFLDQVAGQSLPPNWPKSLSEADPTTGGLREFPLDPQLHSAESKVAPTGSDLVDSLKSAPIVVLSVDPDQLFGEDGIYRKSSQVPARKVPAEVVWMDGTKGTSGSVGRASLAVSGQSSRSHFVTLKHSLRVSLSQTTDVGEIFGKPAFPCRQFLLRQPTQDSWAVGGPWNIRRAGAKYVTDSWASAWLGSQGQQSLAHRWVHVFLNGTYWGVYDAVEQHDAAYGARHGFKGPIHLVEPDTETGSSNVRPIIGSATGWTETLQGLRQAMVGGAATTDKAWASAAANMDVPGFIDYMLWNWWLANGDWPARNWLASHGGGKWSLLSWDAEMALPMDGDVPNMALRIEADQRGPGAAFVLLCHWADFRRQVTQRLAALTADAGPLGPARISASWERALGDFRPLALSESLRWGALYQVPPLAPADWEKAVARVSRKFLPERSATLVSEVNAFLARIEKQTAARLSQIETAPPSQVTLPPTVAVPLDGDGDGMPDEWELAKGFNPADPADAMQDKDGDGISNLDEFFRLSNPLVQDAPRSSAEAPSVHTKFSVHQRRRVLPAAR